MGGWGNRVMHCSGLPAGPCLSLSLAQLDAIFQRKRASPMVTAPFYQNPCSRATLLSLARVTGDGTLVVIHTEHRYNLEASKDAHTSGWPRHMGTRCVKQDQGSTAPSILPHRALDWSRTTRSTPASSPGFGQGWEISAQSYTLKAAS